MDKYFITPQEFGAIGDGVADDTKAVQDAMNSASEKHMQLYVPAGIYKVDEIAVPKEIEIRSEATWTYKYPGKTVFIPKSETQRCIFNLSNAYGTTIYGIGIDGKKLGNNLHGLYMNREEKEIGIEHSLRIDCCKICGCSGDGAHFEGAWAVGMRHSQSSFNDGDGFYLDGTDAFIVDNWFSGNGKSGFGGDTWNSAVNFTSNRVEWNKECGIKLSGGMRYNLTGNYIDRSYGPAIIIEDAENYHKRLQKTHTIVPYAITVTGNTIVRSGKDAEDGSDRDCHIYMRKAAGITITGNTFNVWKDDGRNGRISPWYGIIVDRCAHCTITGNTMLPGAVKELIIDKGGHGPGMIIKDNPGATIPEKAWNCQDPFTPVHFMSEGGAEWYSDILAGENNE